MFSIYLYLFLIGLGVFGITITVMRWVRNQNQKGLHKKIVERIQNDDAFLKKLSLELSEPCIQVNSPAEFNFSVVNEKLSANTGISNFTVEHHQALGPNEHLVITTCFDTDFDTNIVGTSQSVKKVHNINFKIRYKPDQQKILISSDFVRDSQLKGLRLNFARYFFYTLGIDPD